MNDNAGHQALEVQVCPSACESGNEIRGSSENDVNAALGGDLRIVQVRCHKYEGADHRGKHCLFGVANLILARPTEEQTAEYEFLKGGLHPENQKVEENEEGILRGIHTAEADIADGQQIGKYHAERIQTEDDQRQLFVEGSADAEDEILHRRLCNEFQRDDGEDEHGNKGKESEEVLIGNSQNGIGRVLQEWLKGRQRNCAASKSDEQHEEPSEDGAFIGGNGLFFFGVVHVLLRKRLDLHRSVPENADRSRFCAVFMTNGMLLRDLRFYFSINRPKSQAGNRNNLRYFADTNRATVSAITERIVDPQRSSKPRASAACDPVKVFVKRRLYK